MIELLTVIAIISVLAALLLPSLAKAKATSKTVVCKSNLRQVGLGLNLLVDDTEIFPGAPPHVAFAHGEAIQEWFGNVPVIKDRAIMQIAPYVGAGGYGEDGTYLGRPRNSVLVCPARLKAKWIVHGAPSLRSDWPPLGYGYNSLGTLWRPPAVRPLGLAPIVLADQSVVPVKEGGVSVPSAMVAWADSVGELGENVSPYFGGRQPFGLDNRHRDGANAVFVDGHVELKTRKVWTAESVVARRLWNNDHEPHSETWN